MNQKFLCKLVFEVLKIPENICKKHKNFKVNLFINKSESLRKMLNEAIKIPGVVAKTSGSVKIYTKGFLRAKQ